MDHPAPVSLIEAYLKAVYRAHEGPGRRWHAMRLDPGSPLPSDDPARLPFAQPWAIITAWNPMSGRMPDAENDAAQARLVEAVRALGLRFHPAEGVDASEPPTWREESILVEGLEMKPAVQLMRVFRQRAAVYCEGGRVGLLFAEPERWEVHPLRIIQAGASGGTSHGR